MMPCIWPSLPPKVYPSGGESGLPLLSNFTMALLPYVVPHTLSCESIARPKPMPSTPPPVKPVGCGDSGFPLGENLERLPAHNASWICAPTIKLSPAQALPALANMSLPGPLNPPPVTLSGKIHALGEYVRYGMKGAGRMAVSYTHLTLPTKRIV